MTGAELITQVRYWIRDTSEASFSDAELLTYANDGILSVAADLLTARHHYFVTTGSFEDGDALPTGWVAWCGQFPVKQQEGVLCISGEDPLDLKYLRKPTLLATVAGDIDLPSEALPALVATVAALALNRCGLDVSQDVTLAATAQQAANKIGFGG